MKKILIIFLLLLISGCSSDEVVYTNKVNLNDLIIMDREIDDIKFTNTSVIYDRGISTFRVTLKSDKLKHIDEINVIFKNKNGSDIVTLKGLINKDIKEEDLVITSDIDLTEAYNLEYKW